MQILERLCLDCRGLACSTTPQTGAGGSAMRGPVWAASTRRAPWGIGAARSRPPGEVFVCDVNEADSGSFPDYMTMGGGSVRQPGATSMCESSMGTAHAPKLPVVSGSPRRVRTERSDCWGNHVPPRVAEPTRM